MEAKAFTISKWDIVKAFQLVKPTIEVHEVMVNRYKNSASI